MKAMCRLLPALLIVLSLDGMTKVWAEELLVLHQPVPIVGQAFRLTLGYNTGAGFGLFASSGPVLAVVAGIVIIGLLAWLVRASQAKDLLPAASWPIGMLLGGAIANVVDRLPDGRVTDFLDLGVDAARWPTFNLADVFITLSVVVIILGTILRNQKLETKTGNG